MTKKEMWAELEKIAVEVEADIGEAPADPAEIANTIGFLEDCIEDKRIEANGTLDDLQNMLIELSCEEVE